MKKLFFLGIVVTFLSCSTNSPTTEDFYLEFLPIESVTMPNEMVYGKDYIINYSYFKPSTCHSFNDLYYDVNDNIKTIAVIAKVLRDNGTLICESLNGELEERSFTFHVNKNTGAYIFKFWQGEDANGQAKYLVYEVPIAE